MGKALQARFKPEFPKWAAQLNMSENVESGGCAVYVQRNLTCVLDLRLAGLGWCHDPRCGLGDPFGGLLETGKVWTALVGFDLKRSNRLLLLNCFKVHSSANVAGNLLLYLRSCDQLSRAGGDLMRTHHQLLKLALALHQLISCITTGRKQTLLEVAQWW